VIADSVDDIATQTGFSGVVRLDRGDTTEFAKAYGLAHRGYSIANTVDTRFAIASGTKGLTALVVVSLIESGRLSLATTARSLLGDDLPLIDDRVTVAQLLSHRSGIGDYFAEGLPDDYMLPVGVHALATTEQYLQVMDGYPTMFAPDERFTYNNGGFVVLALLAERASGSTFHELVRERVTEPAGMVDTEFLRSDEPDRRTALGYLADDGLRTNVHHLPVMGNGDGGIYSTAADAHALWAAFFAGRIVSDKWVSEMIRSRSDVPANSMRYGLGFWLHESRDVVMLYGGDVGVSFYSGHDPAERLTWTVLSNTYRGVRPIGRHLDSELGFRAG